MFIYIFLLIVLICLAYYFLYYQPIKRINKFAKNAQQLGYKVKVMPYKFMGYYLLQYMMQDQRSLKVFKQEFSKYDLIVGNMFTTLAVLPSSTKIIKDLFNQIVKLHKNPFFSELFLQLNGGGIVFSQGQIWKRKRRIISQVFHFDFLNQIIPLIKQQTQKQFTQVDKQIESNQSINLLNSFTKILSSIVAKCFFGTDMNQYIIEGKPYCQFFTQTIDQLSRYSFTLQHMIFRMKLYDYGLSKKSRQLKRKLQIARSIAKQIVVKQINKIKNKQQTNKNILTTLFQKGLLNNDTDVIDPNKYTVDELIGQFFTFFIAGTDTTSHTLNLAMHYLSQNPCYIKRIEKQLYEINQDELNQVEALKQMKWIQAVFNECLRINGPSSGLISRIASQNLNLGGLQIPKGTSISIFPLVNNYKSQYFENPQKFVPQRWMANKKLDAYAYIPFSGGQRNCIGQYLSRIEGKLVLSYLLSKYSFKSNKPIKMKVQFVYSTEYSDFSMKLKY